MKVIPAVLAESEEYDYMSLCYGSTDLGTGSIAMDKIEGLSDVTNNLYQCIEELDAKYKILLEAIGILTKKNKRLDGMLQEIYYPYKTKGE